MPQLQTASYCACFVCQLVGSSRSVVRANLRWRSCFPAAELGSDRGEEDAEVVVRIRLWLADGADDLGRPAVHARCALRCRGRQYKPADERGPSERDLLGDEAAERKAEDVDVVQVHRGDERDRVLCHLGHGARCGSGGTTDAGVVEGHDRPGRGQRVDQRRIPVVQVAAEVLQEDQRDRAFAELAVRVVDAVRAAYRLVGRLAVCARGDRIHLQLLWPARFGACHRDAAAPRMISATASGRDT